MHLGPLSYRIGVLKPREHLTGGWRAYAAPGCPSSHAISKQTSTKKRWHKLLLQIVVDTILGSCNATRVMDVCLLGFCSTIKSLWQHKGVVCLQPEIACLLEVV